MKAGTMSVRSKSKKLTASTTSIGGAMLRYRSRRCRSGRRELVRRLIKNGHVGTTRSSGRDELVPAPGQVAVLVHHRVPAGDVAHAVPDGAAVARRALLFHQGAVGILDVDRGGLAVVPVVPFLGRQELLGRRR